MKIANLVLFSKINVLSNMKHFLLLTLSFLYTLFSMGYNKVGDVISEYSLGVNITYTITYPYESGSVGKVRVGDEISPCINSSTNGNVVIPQYIRTSSGYTYAVEEIGKNAFKNCWAVTSVSLSDWVVQICESAFEGCTSLRKIDLCKVRSVGTCAFKDCSSLTEITFPTTTNYNSNVYIGDEAFSGCTALTLLHFTDKVRSLGSKSFGGCTSLSEVTFPDQQINFKKEVFVGCSSLKSIYSYMSNITGLTTNDCFNGIHPNAILYVPHELKMKYQNNPYWRESFSQIRSFPPKKGDCFTIMLTAKEAQFEAMFEVLDEKKYEILLKEIKGNSNGDCLLEVPSEITVFDDWIFSLKEIGEYSFSQTGITSVIIGGGIIRVRDSAFKGNKRLRSISFPKSINAIEANALEGCEALDSVIVNWKRNINIDFNADGMAEIFKKASLYVPSGTKHLYESHPVLKSFNSIVEQRMNYKFHLPIYVNSQKDVIGLQFKIIIPDNVSVAHDSKGNIIKNSIRTENMLILWNEDPIIDNEFIVLLFSDSGNSLFGTEGPVMTISLATSSSPESLLNKIIIENVIAVTSSSGSVIPLNENMYEIGIGSIVSAGDVNNDGIINVTDAVGIVNHILKNTPETFTIGSADINEDGIINVTDAVSIVNLILEKENEALSRMLEDDMKEPQ